ncbi:hypothetical protein ALC57_08898 [Trachymyrmex cornetzi]|uniref:DUF8207 domain-containing protein n=1 Tax=Trachymyrmex cornetzi TaxID=471704 RepID=A0A151J6D8_9HYME|nr:hypothetical protein ALC57_08898 [Trachymyrmex cornetzi]
MDSTKKSIAERERTAKLIAKTRASIRKKHRALKTDILENEIALEKRFKPISEPLKQIVENTERENKLFKIDKVMENKQKNKQSQQQQQQQQQVYSFELEDEEVFEEIGDDPSLETSVRQILNTPQGRNRLYSQLGRLGQIYVNTLLIGDKRNEIDLVYGVYFNENGTMLRNKNFDIDSDDTIIIVGVRYKGTPGLYELIFKRIPNDAIYTENDRTNVQTYIIVNECSQTSP